MLIMFVTPKNGKGVTNFLYGRGRTMNQFLAFQSIALQNSPNNSGGLK